MTRLLCPWCLKRLGASATDPELRELYHKILDREISIAIWYHQCANHGTVGHPNSQTYVLEELPPSAKA